MYHSLVESANDLYLLTIILMHVLIISILLFGALVPSSSNTISGTWWGEQGSLEIVQDEECIFGNFLRYNVGGSKFLGLYDQDSGLVSWSVLWRQATFELTVWSERRGVTIWSGQYSNTTETITVSWLQTSQEKLAEGYWLTNSRGIDIFTRNFIR